MADPAATTTDLSVHDVSLAYELAATVHRDQVDLVGDPYILHPVRVALAVREAGFDNTHQVVAVLHDVIEDSPRHGPFRVSHRNLQDRFGKEAADAIHAMSRRGQKGLEEPYHDYILRLRFNEIARVVKLHDLADNLARIPRLIEVASTDKEHERARALAKRYKSAVRALK